MLSQKTLPALIALLSVAPTYAQDVQVLAAPPAILDRLDLESGTVQRLVLPFDNTAPFTFAIDLDGARRVIDVAPYDLRAPDFQMFERADGQLTPLDSRPAGTYRGTVRGIPDSTVAVTLADGQLGGVILLRDGEWWIEPATRALRGLPRTAHVVHRDAAVRSEGLVCGVTNAPQGPAAVGSPDGIMTAELALEVTPRFRNAFGGRTQAINQVNTIINSVDAIYQRDTSIRYQITRIVSVRDAGYSSSPSAALSQMRSLWATRGAGIRRDLAQAFEGSPSSSTIGIAYLRGVCTTNGVSICWLSSSLARRVTISAHEMGHNWGSGHCSGGGCRIMCARIGGCSGILNSFGSGSANTISNFAASRSCVQ